MSIIFNRLVQCADHFANTLGKHGTLVDEGHDFGWPNYVFTSNKFRRAHLDIIDARQHKKLYMLHLCIFPHTNDCSPIFGFDLIAGPKKVTGAFHDFSPIGTENHFMADWFHGKVKDLVWSKKRDLPEWARNIFSDDMIAAGNISDEAELDIITGLVRHTLDYYLDNVGSTRVDYDTTDRQDLYCYNQRQNPHTPKVMASLGIDDETIEKFIKDCLFPPVL